MVKHDVANFVIAAAHVKNMHTVLAAAKFGDNRIEFLTVGNAMQRTVRRRQHGRRPADRSHRSRQISNYVTDSTNFGARQRIVFCGNE